jgi:16S rRNA processing protein RimM
MIKQEEVFKIGMLGKPHGLNGEMAMSFTDDVFDRVDADYLVLSIDDIMVPFFIEEYKFRSNESLIIKFVNVDNVNQASELTGIEVYFPWSLNKTDENEEFTYQKLTGYTVVDADNGEEIGKITQVDESTTNILFEVSIDDGRDILLPASEELIKDINRNDRTITMIIPNGLLDI